MLRNEEERHDAILALLIRERQAKEDSRGDGWSSPGSSDEPKMKVHFHQPIWIVLLD